MTGSVLWCKEWRLAWKLTSLSSLDPRQAPTDSGLWPCRCLLSWKYQEISSQQRALWSCWAQLWRSVLSARYRLQFWRRPRRVWISRCWDRAARSCSCSESERKSKSRDGGPAGSRRFAYRHDSHRLCCCWFAAYRKQTDSSAMIQTIPSSKRTCTGSPVRPQ